MCDCQIMLIADILQVTLTDYLLSWALLNVADSGDENDIRAYSTYY